MGCGQKGRDIATPPAAASVGWHCSGQRCCSESLAGWVVEACVAVDRDSVG